MVKQNVINFYHTFPQSNKELLIQGFIDNHHNIVNNMGKKYYCICQKNTHNKKCLIFEEKKVKCPSCGKTLSDLPEKSQKKKKKKKFQKNTNFYRSSAFDLQKNINRISTYFTQKYIENPIYSMEKNELRIVKETSTKNRAYKVFISHKNKIVGTKGNIFTCSCTFHADLLFKDNKVFCPKCYRSYLIVNSYEQNIKYKEKKMRNLHKKHPNYEEIRKKRKIRQKRTERESFLLKYEKKFNTQEVDLKNLTSDNFNYDEIRLGKTIIDYQKIEKKKELELFKLKEKKEKEVKERKKELILKKNETDDFVNKYYTLFKSKHILNKNLTTEYFNSKELGIAKKLLEKQRINDEFEEKRKERAFLHNYQTRFNSKIIKLENLTSNFYTKEELEVGKRIFEKQANLPLTPLTSNKNRMKELHKAMRRH